MISKWKAGRVGNSGVGGVGSRFGNEVGNALAEPPAPAELPSRPPPDRFPRLRRSRVWPERAPRDRVLD